MADSRSLLEIVVDVKNAATGAKEIRDVGKAGKDAAAGAEESGKGFGGMAKNLAAAAGGAVVAKKGFDFLKDAASSAQTLAKQTAALTRETGLDASSSSAWVSMAKSRGIESGKLETSLKAFSKQQVALQQGNKGTVDSFKQLGLTQTDLSKNNTDFYGSLLMVADQFAAMPAGADKTALATKMFGKQGLDLLPILNQGSAGIEEQLGKMDKLGLTMDEKGVKKAQELGKAQRDLKGEMDGVKLTIGQALIPVLVDLANMFMPVVSSVADLLRSSPILSTAAVVLAAGLGGVVLAVKAWGIAQMILNSALFANPIGLVVLAIIGLIAALVIVYSKVGWFRDAVNAAFGAIKTAVGAVVNFIKDNWQSIGLVLLALTGPIGLVIAAFIKFKDQVASVVQAVIDTIMKIPNAVKSVADTVGGALSDIGGGIGGALGKLSPFQYGGVVGAGGTLALVGERGPELMHLPGGTRITPLQAGTAQPVDLGAAGLGGGDLHIHLDVDGRELAHVVATEAGLQQARR